MKRFGWFPRGWKFKKYGSRGRAVNGGDLDPMSFLEDGVGGMGLHEQCVAEVFCGDSEFFHVVFENSGKIGA